MRYNKQTFSRRCLFVVAFIQFDYVMLEKCSLPENLLPIIFILNSHFS